jgi:hypothetical protein
MPLGAVTILAVYCLSLIDLTGPTHGAGPLAGVAATVGVHVWRNNTVLSLVTGTTVCVVISTLLRDVLLSEGANRDTPSKTNDFHRRGVDCHCVCQPTAVE